MIAWNKGETKETDPRIKSHLNYFTQGHTQAKKDLIRAASRESWKDPEIRAKRISSNTGKKRNFSVEVIAAATARLVNYSKAHPELAHLGGMGTRKHYQDLGFTREGEDSYPYEWTKEFKRTIKNRDNWTCQDCSIKQNDLTKSGKWLLVHHIDADKSNLEMSNLVTLCKSCHLTRHHKLNGHTI